MSKIYVENERIKDESVENHLKCPICDDDLQPNRIEQMPCCSIKICLACFLTYLTESINLGKAKIQCPSCTNDINPSIILLHKNLPIALRGRYQKFVAQCLSEKKNTSIKLCPYCKFITILNEKDPIKKQKKHFRLSNKWIKCEQCQQEWCWLCDAPSHPNLTCEQNKNDQKKLDMWAKTIRGYDEERNAQRCPKCSIYIEKIEGCDHMLCSKCNSKFCYRCGNRLIITRYIGHDNKFSILGCKYTLFPDQPLLRWSIRFLIFILFIIFVLPLIVVVAIVLVVLAIVLVVLAIPILISIGCYFLINFISEKCC